MLILGLATALRFYHLGGQSLWADEGNSAVMATRSFAEITTNAANDIHPPLYYWLLRLWTQFAGVSEVGLRSLSALLGVLLVFATIGLGLRMGGVGIGLLAGLLAAVSPFQVYYSQEARMYMLLALEAAGAVYGFWALLRHEEQRPREWAARPQEPGRQADDRAAPSAAALPWPMPLIFLSWVAGLYTHYAFPVLIATLSLVYLIWLVVTRRRGRVLARVGRLAMLLGLTLVAFLPWLGIAIRQITGWPTGGQSTDLVKALSTIFTVLVLGPTGRLAAAQWPIWLSMAVLTLGLIPWRQTLKRSSGMGWLLPILWLAAPLAMMLALGLVREAYLKFLLIASPAVALLLARGVLGPGSSVGNLGERSPDAEPDALHTRPRRFAAERPGERALEPGCADPPLDIVCQHAEPLLLGSQSGTR